MARKVVSGHILIGTLPGKMASLRYNCPSKTRETRLLKTKGISTHRSPNHHGEDLNSMCCPKCQLHHGKTSTPTEQTLWGRPGRTTTDSLHHLIKWVRDSLRQGYVVSALFLNISGAFPNISIPMLIHNMRKRGIPEEYTRWLEHQLKGQKTTLHLDGYKSVLRNVDNGLEQGCSGSPLWFLFSNADLIEDNIFTKDDTGTAFINNTYYAARAKTPEESNTKLEKIMTGPGGALEWAKSHHACFELDKNALMIFSNKRVPDPARPGKTMAAHRPPITINGHVNTPVASTKFLGLILNQNLTFKQHADYATAKGRFWVNQTKRISKTVKGMKGVFSRRLYLSVCVP